MRRIILLALGALFSVCASAQSNLATKIKNEGVVEATITVDGNAIEGYIKKVPNWQKDTFSYSPFWEQQELIKFIDKKTFASIPRLRPTHYTDYTPKNCEGFAYDGIEFRTMKYSDAAGVSSVMAKKLFLRKVGGNSKVAFYIHYRKPVSNATVADIKNVVDNPDMAFALDGSDKAKNVDLLNVKKDINCPKIADKVASDGYPTTRTPEMEAQLTGYSGTFSHAESVTSLQLNILEDLMNGVCD